MSQCSDTVALFARRLTREDFCERSSHASPQLGDFPEQHRPEPSRQICQRSLGTSRRDPSLNDLIRVSCSGRCCCCCCRRLSFASTQGHRRLNLSQRQYSLPNRRRVGKDRRQTSVLADERREVLDDLVRWIGLGQWRRGKADEGGDSRGKAGLEVDIVFVLQWG